jgi:hypothetical protein
MPYRVCGVPSGYPRARRAPNAGCDYEGCDGSGIRHPRGRIDPALLVELGGIRCVLSHRIEPPYHSHDNQADGR